MTLKKWSVKIGSSSLGGGRREYLHREYPVASRLFGLKVHGEE